MPQYNNPISEAIPTRVPLLTGKPSRITTKTTNLMASSVHIADIAIVDTTTPFISRIIG